MNKYKKLFSDTVIFAIGTFSSKVLVFALMPLYTNILTKGEYGTADLIVQTGNLLYPMVTLGIVSGCVRYALDSSYDKREVFSTGVKTILFGLLVLFCVMPVFYFVGFISSFKLLTLIFLFVAMSAFRGLCSQFTRAIGKVRLYAFDGILSTLLVVVFNVLFLVVFRWGVYGYVLSTICSDALSTVFLVVAGKLHQYVKVRNTNRRTMESMLRYSIPLIPNTISWWITNTSDRYLITIFSGNEVNGLYAAAQKLPTIIVLVSNIFMDAWQLSAVSDMTKEERGSFFTKVFNGYWALTCIASSGIILIAKPFIHVWLGREFYDSWKFVPFLVLAMAFSCFVTFLGSVYMVHRKSNLSFVTTGIGAVMNIALNVILIPIFGGNGAAFATFISYGAVFIIRMRSTEQFIKIGYNIPKIVISTALLLLQSAVLLLQVRGWIIWQIVILLVIVGMFFTDLLKPILALLVKKNEGNGKIMGKLSSLVERIKNMSFQRLFMNVREVKKKSKRSRLSILIDMVWCAFRYGVGYLDYNVFGFAFVRGKAKRRTYMTMNHNMLLTGKVNDLQYVEKFQNKIEFNKTFDGFLGRKWIDLRETSRKQFKKFLKRKQFYFVKVVDGCGGSGVEKLDVGNTINYKKTYDTLKEKKQFLVEEALVQHPTMNRLCPTSINTLRITTVLKDGEPIVMYTLVRMGDGTKAVDNISSGGMYCPVNDRGVITAPAFSDKTGSVSERHPMTKERFVNFRIPLYRDAVAMVKKAAKVVPQMGYIGWDVAITENGPAIVEGNTVPGYDMCQNYEHIGDQGGILPKFEEYFGKDFNLVGHDAVKDN